MHRIGFSILSWFALLTATTVATANGRYPTANQIAFDPTDANHLVVATTFGLFESRDGGQSFSWRCEEAMGRASQNDEMVAVTASGATVVARFDGMAVTADGCSFGFAAGTSGRPFADIAHSVMAPHDLVALEVQTQPAGAYQSQIVGSSDDGRTWRVVGPVPSDVFPLTIDVAPSDESRIYISGYLDRGDHSSVLLRSDDGGLTFQRTAIPGTSDYRLAWIAAVHPQRADRIYMRVQNPVGTDIWWSDDGGRVFQKAFSGAGNLLGFAVSADGQQVAVGGPLDGLWLGSADAMNLSLRSDIAPSCLGWSSSGLYACVDWKASGFLIRRSIDSGATFDETLGLDALCGHTGCAEGTSVGMACPANWPAVARALGVTCGTEDPTVGGLGDATSDGAFDARGVSGSADAGVTDRGAAGGCALVGVRPFAAPFLFPVLSLLAFQRRRDRRPPIFN